MPIPKPNEGESQKDFISRCMGNKTMVKEYPKEKQRAGVCYSQWRSEENVKRFNKVLKIGIRRTQEEVSKKPWNKIRKNKLPASCFLWVENLEKKETWHLPYKEGAGGVDPQTKMYRKAGKVNINAIRNILQNVNLEQAPDDIKKKVKELVKKFGVGKFNKKEEPILVFDNFKELRKLRGVQRKKEKEMKKKYKSVTKVLKEASLSLDSELRKAIQKDQGSNAWLADFSPNEVVYSKREDNVESFYKRKYTITNGEIVLQGSPERVERKVAYESENLNANELIELVEYERQLKRKV